mmetsp:Transcript_27762/g.42034  ORF Transcript_27762/g.42034 Transcript_27762/m.42034 type:complete len:226 (-) Transcript_27762:575-1252(-)|eukprot:CAMPEP_0194761322 /NCGR_PEP_ID=MMETSP0323_2-20130528/14049_1 /TAXON_ID=2866 ORGANISM="Crypthecodinium cohnii, Strain Seligo" /NCGR_SAMPLE_ID=MMETSP0323_2 /ASSEMBLY_ACC=CAM_ASM_000346 /LENGTH=225 /DNA_ID=CAMNT_0039682999 /DNA_START=24 /DNA_END=701 /DNA_ORIENTATION=-
MAFGRAALLSMVGVTLSELAAGTKTFIHATWYSDSACATTSEMFYVTNPYCLEDATASYKYQIAEDYVNVLTYSTTDCTGTDTNNMAATIGQCYAVAGGTSFLGETVDVERYSTTSVYSTGDCSGTSTERVSPLIPAAHSGATITFDSSSKTVTTSDGTSYTVGVCLAAGDSKSYLVTEIVWDGTTYATTSGLASWAAQLSPPSFLTTSAAALLSVSVATALGTQ